MLTPVHVIAQNNLVPQDPLGLLLIAVVKLIQHQQQGTLLTLTLSQCPLWHPCTPNAHRTEL